MIAFHWTKVTAPIRKLFTKRDDNDLIFREFIQFPQKFIEIFLWNITILQNEGTSTIYPFSFLCVSSYQSLLGCKPLVEGTWMTFTFPENYYFWLLVINTIINVGWSMTKNDSRRVSICKAEFSRKREKYEQDGSYHYPFRRRCNKMIGEVLKEWNRL